MRRQHSYIGKTGHALALLLALLLLCPALFSCEKKEEDGHSDEAGVIENVPEENGNAETSGTENVPESDTESEKSEKGENNEGDVGTKPEAGEKDAGKDGEKDPGKEDGKEGGSSGKTDKDPEKSEEVTGLPFEDRWVIRPSYVYDSLETFGMSGYSIYRIGENYGILDMNASGIGTGDYSYLFYCPTHGLSCPDILEVPIEMREDLLLSPDCGYRPDPSAGITYVYDNTRDRVYAAATEDGKLRIVDITDTEYFENTPGFTAVLYDCDADIMMYEDCGMTAISEVFEAENTKMYYGVVRNDFEMILPFIYDSVEDGNDCYLLCKGGKYGYASVKGRELYPCVFEDACTAYKGKAWVKYGGKWGTIRF